MTAELQQDDAAGAADRLGSVGPAAATGAEGARCGPRQGSECGARAGAARACGAAGTERQGAAEGTRRGAGEDGGAGGSCSLGEARAADPEFGSLKSDYFGKPPGLDVGVGVGGVCIRDL